MGVLVSTITISIYLYWLRARHVCVKYRICRPSKKVWDRIFISIVSKMEASKVVHCDLDSVLSHRAVNVQPGALSTSRAQAQTAERRETTRPRCAAHGHRTCAWFFCGYYGRQLRTVVMMWENYIKFRSQYPRIKSRGRHPCLLTWISSAFRQEQTWGAASETTGLKLSNFCLTEAILCRRKKNLGQL